MLVTSRASCDATSELAVCTCIWNSLWFLLPTTQEVDFFSCTKVVQMLVQTKLLQTRSSCPFCFYDVPLEQNSKRYKKSGMCMTSRDTNTWQGLWHHCYWESPFVMQKLAKGNFALLTDNIVHCCFGISSRFLYNFFSNVEQKDTPIIREWMSNMSNFMFWRKFSSNAL